MKHILFALFLTLPLLAGNLELKEGFVAAHTEMMMDSSIDPLNNDLHADMSMEGDDLMTLRGKLWVEMSLFSSDNAKRDKNMHETNEVEKYPLATYSISTLTHIRENAYTLNGELTFHGKTKPFSFNTEIFLTGETVTINATSKLLVSDFGMEMPCMLFMCVKDQVDIFAKAVLSK